MVENMVEQLQRTLEEADYLNLFESEFRPSYRTEEHWLHLWMTSGMGGWGYCIHPCSTSGVPKPWAAANYRAVTYSKLDQGPAHTCSSTHTSSRLAHTLAAKLLTHVHQQAARASRPLLMLPGSPPLPQPRRLGTATLLDLSVTFDITDHSILLHELRGRGWAARYCAGSLPSFSDDRRGPTLRVQCFLLSFLPST